MKKYFFIIILVLAFFAALGISVSLLFGDHFAPREETRHDQLEKIFGVQGKIQCYSTRLGEVCSKEDVPIPADALKREFANFDECVQTAARQYLNVEQSLLTIGNVASMEKSCKAKRAGEKSKADAAVLRHAQQQAIEKLPIR